MVQLQKYRNISLMNMQKKLSLKYHNQINKENISGRSRNKHSVTPTYFNGSPLVQKMHSRIESRIKQHDLSFHLKTEPTSRLTSHTPGLSNRNMEVNKKIEQIRKDIDEQQVSHCSFHPQINTNKTLQGDVIQRNQIWLEEKKKKEFQKRQERINTDMEQCTFSPAIVSKQSSSFYLKKKRKDREKSTLNVKKIQLQQSIESNKKSYKKVSKELSESQYEKGKRQIYKKLHFGL